MPTASRTRPKKRPVAKAKVKPRMKMKAKMKVKARAPKVKVPKHIGRVVHYYDRIGVAIVELALPLSLGDTVLLKHGEEEYTQPVTSLQIEHEPVKSARKGKVVGMKVDRPMKDGTWVLPI